MAKPGDRLKSVLFRPTVDGWVFRSPNPWVFGDTPHYLVNAAQKAQIEAILTPPRPAVVAVVLVAGIVAWAALVATFMWAFSGHADPTPGDIGLIFFLISVPAVAVLPIAGVIQRRRLAPVLEGALLTTERISYAELRQNVRAATPLKQSVNALVASLFAFFAASFAVLIHLVTRHFAFDAYVAQWGFIALAFGFASFVWYRQVLSKAATLEGDRGARKGLMKWIGLSGIVLICALALLYLAVGRSGAWGALAVGRAPGAGTVTVSVVGKATKEIAREAALQACRIAKNGNDAARSACEVVATFHQECFAFAGAEWAIAADEQSARKAAAAKCSGGSCTVVSGCGTKTAWR
jgi:hypothetical protein